MGQCVIQNFLDNYLDGWDELEWKQYTNALRLCRKKFTKDKILNLLNKMEIKDKVLINIVLQLSLKRNQRSNIYQINKYINKYINNSSNNDEKHSF